MPIASGQTWEHLDNVSLEATPFYMEPDKYLQPSDTMRKDLLSVSKKLYDFMKDFEIYANQTSSLDELLVSGFDNEQIWQEIELQNGVCIPRFKSSLKDVDVNNICFDEKGKTVEKQKKSKKTSKKKKTKQNSIEGEEEEIQNEHYNEDNDSMEEEEEEDEEGDKTQTRKNYKSTVVDDEFFQLRQMEDCLDQLDEAMNDENKGRGANKGMFEDECDEDERCTFQHFFDPPATSKSKQKKDAGVTGTGDDEEKEEDGMDNGDGSGRDELDGNFDDVDDDDENGEDKNEDENKEGIDENDAELEDNDPVDGAVEGDAIAESTFERKQKQMQKKIQKLEEENLSEKPWQLMGETVAKARPMNSLLEEYVSFDHSSVGAPTITEDTTLSLEELIKQRIKDHAWDDVLRKEKPVLQPFEYKKAPELNQEKSKISLAEVYEKEYLKQVEDEKEDKENEEHVAIQKLMDRLFVQLDALSNFHFTPKPPQPEIKVITNVPSLQMEEVLPITMTESSQLAPEEVLEKKKGELVGAEEKTDEDRKRDRRQKKIKKKFAAKAQEKKEKSGKVAKSQHKQAVDSLKKGVRNTIVNSKTSKTEKAVKGSSDFFNKLQDEVKKNITKETSKGKKDATKTKKSVEFLKL